MSIKFNKISDYDRGMIYNLLSQAYSFDEKWEQADKEKWRESDDLFFDNPQIADQCVFITSFNDDAIGLAMYDPRNLPQYAIIGHNCIIPQYKGQGYGTMQLRELIRRITENNAEKIFVSTSFDLIPAQRMYESIGFARMDNETLEPWQIEQRGDIYYSMTVKALEGDTLWI